MVYSTVPASIGLARTTSRLQETAGRAAAALSLRQVIGPSNRRVAYRAARERRLILPGPLTISGDLVVWRIHPYFRKWTTFA
jgi:hypothetical protein